MIVVFPGGAYRILAIRWRASRKRLFDAIDAADEQNCRPDFAVVVYPGYLALAERNFANNRDITVTDNPPSFIVMAGDDPVHVENATVFPDAKKRKSSGQAAYLFARRRPRLRPSPHHSTRHDVAAKRRNLVAHNQCDPLLAPEYRWGQQARPLRGRASAKLSLECRRRAHEV